MNAITKTITNSLISSRKILKVALGGNFNDHTKYLLSSQVLSLKQPSTWNHCARKHSLNYSTNTCRIHSVRIFSNLLMQVSSWDSIQLLEGYHSKCLDGVINSRNSIRKCYKPLRDRTVKILLMWLPNNSVSYVPRLPYNSVTRIPMRRDFTNRLWQHSSLKSWSKTSTDQRTMLLSSRVFNSRTSRNSEARCLKTSDSQLSSLVMSYAMKSMVLSMWSRISSMKLHPISKWITTSHASLTFMDNQLPCPSYHVLQMKRILMVSHSTITKLVIVIRSSIQSWTFYRVHSKIRPTPTFVLSCNSVMLLLHNSDLLDALMVRPFWFRVPHNLHMLSTSTLKISWRISVSTYRTWKRKNSRVLRMEQ